MRCPILIASALVAAPAALADTFEPHTALAFDADAARAEQPAPTEAPAPESQTPAPETPEARVVFGAPGPWWGQLGVGFAYELGGSDPSYDYNLAFSCSTFLVQDFEFIIETSGWYFDQPGDNAFGLNVCLVFRWHFLARDTWSLYIDGGGGVLVSTDLVPEGGTGFNFTPRIGVGGTFQLGQSPNRLVAGVRWDHISNARINGEDRNPSRDGVMVYAALQFPF